MPRLWTNIFRVLRNSVLIYTRGGVITIGQVFGREISSQAVFVEYQGLEKPNTTSFPQTLWLLLLHLFFAIELPPDACGYFKWNCKFKGFPITTKNSVLLILFNKYVIIHCHIFFYQLPSMQPPAESGICRTWFIHLLTATLYLPPNSQLGFLLRRTKKTHCSFSVF